MRVTVVRHEHGPEPFISRRLPFTRQIAVSACVGPTTPARTHGAKWASQA